MIGRLVGSSLAVVVVAASASTVEAGIIVQKNGAVLLGRIEAEDVTDDAVVLHEPEVRGRRLKGTQRVPMHEIRWFDEDAFTLTKEYLRWKDEKLATEWMPVLERLVRNEKEVPRLDGDVVRILGDISERLSWIEVGVKLDGIEASVRKPRRWTVKNDGSLLVLKGEPSRSGVAPRVHLLALRASADTASQLRWVKQEVEKLAPYGFSVEGETTIAPPIGTTADWVTTSRHEGGTVRSIRRIHFAQGHTFLACGYADERDWPAVEPLLRDCVRSLRIREDLPEGAQLKWRTVRGTETAIAGSVSSDAVARLVSRSGVAPVRVGSESVEVGSRRVACTVYEAKASDHSYRVWIARGIPGEVKLVVDGVTERELIEIK